jgi:hypothetical protein
LNPEKCVFGVPRGMLLGFVVSEGHIEANPEKISTIMDMARRAQCTAVQTDEEVLPLYMDPRGARST